MENAKPTHLQQQVQNWHSWCDVKEACRFVENIFPFKARPQGTQFEHTKFIIELGFFMYPGIYMQ